MEIATYALGVVGLALFVAAILTMVAIIREAFPRLNLDEQASLRRWNKPGGKVSTRFDNAVRRAWNAHALNFPKSRKRALFATFLISAALSLSAYPLWLAFGPR
jgi:hypothetical protein